MNKSLISSIISNLKSNYKSIVWATTILFLSVFHVNTPNSVKEYLIPHSDKIVHFTLYAIFSFLLLIENKKSKRNYLRLLFAIFYGILMELFQYFFTKHRSMEFSDILANISGVIFGFFLFSQLSKKLKL